MPAFRKSPRADPAELARIQAVVAPWMADLQQQAWGNPSAFQRIPGQIKAKLAQQGIRLPDGYDVTMDGEVVYTNKTPFLQQAAWAAAPFAGGQAASSLAGLITGGAGAATAGGGALWTGPGAITSQAASTGGGGSGMGLWSTLGKFFGSPGGSRLVDAAGNIVSNTIQRRGADRAADIAGRYNTDALHFLKEQDARDYAEYLKERARTWGFEDEDRRYGLEDRTRKEEDRQLKLLREREREGRLGPFRQGAERGYQTLSSLLYNTNQPMPYGPPVSGATTRRFSDLMRG